MTIAPNSKHTEGLKIARLLMVLSSFAPLFILWAIRGNTLIPTQYFVISCALMVLLPNAGLWLRIRMAKKSNDRRSIAIGSSDDHRDHILVYLFAMLLPFYSEELETLRELAATLAALAFIIFLFWHLNLHYMNLAFAMHGYRIFTVYPPDSGNSLAGRIPFAVITRRVSLVPGEQIIAYRLSNTVYLEDADNVI